MAKLRKFHDHLMEALADPKEARAYMRAALEENDPEFFLVALKDVVEAQGGVGKVAQKTKLNRQNIYSMLSKQGNPEFRSLWTLLKGLGLKISVETEEAGVRKKAA